MAADSELTARSGSRTKADISVLSLVTSADSPFYTGQVDSLAALGVETTTVSVPENRESVTEDRSIVDYVQLLAEVQRCDFDQYDLIHANYGLTGPAAVAQRQLPVVLSLWGSDVYTRYGLIAEYSARFSDAVIVMSEDMRTTLGVDCEVIPHGVDLETFRPIPRKEALNELGWETSKKHVFFPYSTTRLVKNYSLAARVVSTVQQEMDAPVELHTADQWIPHERMYVYMNAADAMILPSDREGSPNTVKEAMACNLPVVSFDLGDVAERLEGVNPSFVCDSEAELVDALISVLRTGERSNGRDHVREISLDRMAERILAVYQRVLSES